MLAVMRSRNYPVHTFYVVKTRSTLSHHSIRDDVEVVPTGSRRAEMVEAAGIIRPSRIIVVTCAVGADNFSKRIGKYRHPDRISNVCAGFHYYDDVAGARYVKTKLVGQHAKEAIAGQRLWVPQHSRH